MPSFPLLLLSPPNARKNFLIDSVLASTPFSSFLLVFFFPPVFAGKTKKGEVETLATLIASPLLDLYRGRNAPLSLFSSYPREIGVGVNIEFVLSEPRTSSFSSAREEDRSSPPTFSHPFSPSKERKRERGGGGGRERRRDTRYTSGARALSVPTIARSECRVRARAAVAGRFPVVSYPRRGK